MVTKKKNKRCIICETKPALDGPYCANCASKIESIRNSSRPVKPVKYITYRGIVVGLYRNGGNTLKPSLLKRNPDKLPKTMTLDLNTYLDGFDRKQIKAFKACCLALAHA